MSLSRLNLILLPALLALAAPSWAEKGPANAKAKQAHPLNLSLPRDVLQAPDNRQIDERVERNLQVPAQPPKGADAQANPATLPYGAGYEHRHQDMGSAGIGAGAGAGAGPAGGTGAGRRGR